MKKGAPFFAAKGSDPNAPMKGDNPQQVPYSTAPGTKPRKPRPVGTGGAYKLKREKRSR